MLRTIGRYSLAVVSVAATLGITSALEQYTDMTPLFYAAIVLTAWFSGMGPGLVAVVLATFALDYFFHPTALHSASGCEAGQLSDRVQYPRDSNQLDECETPTR